MYLVQIFLFILVLECIIAEDIFVPSKEWKTVKKGQKIPQGLHVRMDLSTGETQAKLLDENDSDDNSKTTNSLISLPEEFQETQTDTQFSKSDLKQKLTKLHLDDEILTKNDRNNIKHKFRDYEEIKKTLDEINIKPKLDSEIITELIAEHKKESKKSNVDNEKLIEILENLNYLSHQYDNAIEFVKQDGFENIIYKNLNSTDTKLKQATFKLLSILMQNNNKPKIHALETGALSLILKHVVNENDDLTRLRAISALSSLLRSFPVAQDNFIKTGGFNTLNKIFNTNDVKSQLKIITILSDLIIEKEFASNDIKLKIYYNRIDWYSHLLKYEWCDNFNKMLSNLLKIDEYDHDSIEKCLTAMKAAKQCCGNYYNKTTINEVYQFYSDLLNNNKPDDDSGDNDFILMLKQLSRELLKNDYREKSEL